MHAVHYNNHAQNILIKEGSSVHEWPIEDYILTQIIAVSSDI